MSLDYKILEVNQMVGISKKNSEPVYQVKVRSNFTQNVYTFDDRFGSFLTTKTDDSGRRKEPLPGLASDMAEAVAQASKKGTFGEVDAPVENNPFMALAAAEPENPFMKVGQA